MGRGEREPPRARRSTPLSRERQGGERSIDVRIATTREDAFVAVTLENGRFTALGKTSLDHHLRSDRPLGGENVPAARNISLAADGRWLAVAYELQRHVVSTGGLERTGVMLYDARAMKRVAAIPFSQAHESGVRYDILEMIDGRLFAASSGLTSLHVVELEMPSLKKVRGVEVSTPAMTSDHAFRVQLTSTRGHLFALSHDVLVELTPDLEVVRRRDLHADEVALGPAGEVLTPLGLEAPGKRGDFVREVNASASCSPAWAGAYPLLACTVDMDGLRMARLGPR